MIHWFTKFNPKQLVAVLLILIFIREWQSGYFKGIKDHFKNYRWKFSIIIFVVFSALTAILLCFDPVIFRWVRELSEMPWGHAIADFGGMLGYKVNPWLFMGCWYGIALMFKRNGGVRMAFGSLLGSFGTAAFCHVFKFTLLRARPCGDLGAYSFFNIKGVIQHAGLFQSFPSGDVAIVIGAMGYLFFRAKNYAWRWLLLLFPVMTAMSRMHLNKHWPSDTFFSIGLGLMVGHFILAYENSLNPAGKQKT